MSFCPPVCQHIYWPFCHYVEVSGSMSVSISVNLSVCLCVIHHSSCMYLCVYHSVIFRCSCVSFSVSVHPSVNIIFLLNFQYVYLFFFNQSEFLCVIIFTTFLFYICQTIYQCISKSIWISVHISFIQYVCLTVYLTVFQSMCKPDCQLVCM